MNAVNLNIVLFTCFAVGLPVWLMQNNAYSIDSVHGCDGACYERWKAETGGVVEMARLAAAEAATASPAELGKKAFVGCVACHGAMGGGGIGPQLAGQTTEEITEKLWAYKRGESRGAQSNLMWSNAASLGEQDIENLSVYIETL